ncbi:MAG: hypothetical protein LBK54_06745 [Propionibacteriaceae bacterium]|jgi:hypothetical protein|nr:hypothetical protein [Propionibacteriaceae bacterium]
MFDFLRDFILPTKPSFGPLAPEILFACGLVVTLAASAMLLMEIATKWLQAEEHAWHLKRELVELTDESAD